MPSNNQLQAFREAYRNLQLLPLLKPDELRKFRVEYGTQVIAELEQVVEDCTPANNKIVFTGHRGCGKSTLLAEFGRQVEDRYFVVFFSIADMIEMSDVNHINILFAIAVQLMDKAQQQQIPISPDTKKSIDNWFAKRIRTQTDEVKADIGIGFNIFEFIKNQLKINSSVRNEIKQEFENKISDLISQTNVIANAIINAINKDILVIIDDLDKLDLGVVENIYRSHVKALFQPQFRIIFTIPVAVVRDIQLVRMLEAETDNKLVRMPVTKLFKKGDNRLENATPLAKEASRFEEILYKRINSDLMEPEIAKQIIIYSGGVLRELVRIAKECCSHCLLLLRSDEPPANLKIDQEILAAAINDLRNDFATPLSKVHYRILTTIYEDFTPNNDDELSEQKFLDLLHGLYILEYRNGDLWYDLHPIITELLKRKCLVP